MQRYNELVDLHQVLKITGLSSSTLHHHRTSEKSKTPFPAPVQVLGQSPVWLLSDVVAWCRTSRQRGPGARPRVAR